MRIRDALVLVIALILVAPVPGDAQAPVSHVIILFREGLTSAERERVVLQAGGAATRHFRNVPASSARADARGRAFLERHPDVRAVVPDREVEKLGKPTGSASDTRRRPGGSHRPLEVDRAAPSSLSRRRAQAPVSHVIILFREGLTSAERERVVLQAGGAATRHFRNVPASSARADARGRAFLERHPDVRAVVPDREVEKLGKPTGSASDTAAQAVPAGVARIGAQPGGVGVTGVGVGVAIVDTGIDFQHGDLTVAPTCFTVYAACQDDDGHGTHVSGIVDTGIDFQHGDLTVAPTCFTVYAACQDDDGHGTHVSGIVAAADNEIDVVGVAPAATLYAVKVLDRRGRGTDSTVMAGLDWIADHATAVSPTIRVVNMSLGRPGTLDDNPALRASVQALTAAGLVVVVAAGNDGTLEVGDQVPATYPEVMAVASTTATSGTSVCAWHPRPVLADTASSFTTDGALDALSGIGVSVSAPGEDREDIGKNCLLKSVGILSARLGGGTVRMVGTSMAAPHVTGVVALMAEQSAVTPDDARRRLRLGAEAVASAPLDSPAGGYSFDGEREGVVSAPGAVSTP